MASQARQLADKSVAPPGRRNLIINGAMAVDQRNSGSSAAKTAVGNTGVHFIADRFAINWPGTLDNLQGTVQQASDAPDGFSNSIKWTTTEPEVSLGSDEYVYLSQKIEAQNIQHLEYGSSNAKTLTLSFYVKSSVTGTYGGATYIQDSNRHRTFTYTINTANTWEKKTIVLVGDTNSGDSINDDNGEGMRLIWHLAAGSNYTSTDATSFIDYVAGSWAFGHVQNGVVTTDNATFQLTGVQLEVGSTATEFEHRSYGEELLLCQRYFETMGHRIGGSPYSDIWSKPLEAFTNCWADFRYKVRKRTSPTVTKVSGVWQLGDGGSAPNFRDDSVDALVIQDAGYFYLDSVADGQHCLEVDAEL